MNKIYFTNLPHPYLQIAIHSMKSDKVCCVTTAFHIFVCSTTNSPSITSFQQQCQIRNEYSSWVKLSVLRCYKFSVTSFKEVKLDYLFNSLNKHKFIVLITKDNWKKKKTDTWESMHFYLKLCIVRLQTSHKLWRSFTAYFK